MPQKNLCTNMAKTRDFNRSNVNESTLSVSPLGHSGFDLSNNVDLTPMLGRFMPVNIEKVIPNDTCSGSFKPKLTLEKVGTPTLGRIRMDTHNYFVSARRINKDFRNFVSANAHNQSANAPTFDFKHFVAALLIKLAGSPSQLGINSTLADYVNVFRNQSPVDVARNFYDSFVQDETDDFGFIRDWVLVEAIRLERLPRNFHATNWYAHPESNLAMQILEILRPYIGEDSIACYFGYPILTRFSPVFIDNTSWFTAVGIEELLQRIPSLSAAPIGNQLFGYLKGTDIHPQIIPNEESLIVDESFFRAQYASWFDERRNFHYETSDKVLNPDDFDKNSIIGFFSESAASNYYFACIVQLMIQRYCDYSRDALTTLQPDDVYRHVYSPVPSSSMPPLVTADSSLQGQMTSVDGAISEIIFSSGSFVNQNVPFPGNNPFFSGFSTQQVQALVSDLQTMRRAGMLEKWLARNFYHPDTYSGQIEAHYDCSPIDDGVLAAVYLGGNESQFAGEQQIANVGTSETPVGQRTFTGAAEVSDSFSFHTTEFGYVISFLSLVPLVKYDAINSHIFETLNRDLPFPEYATDARVQYSGGDFIRGLSRATAIGFAPRYQNYRQRVDRACGKYLTDYRAYDFVRDYHSIHAAFDSTVLYDGFTLNPYTMHIHANTDAFLGLSEWDTVAFGDAECMLSFNRVLPAAVEVI